MTYLVGCALLPHPPIMLSEVGGADSEQVQKSAHAAEAAAAFLLKKNPSTIVIITPHGPVFQDAVGINVSPVLRGNLSSFGASEVAVSFETNNLLAQNIIKQSERLGVSLAVLDEHLAQQQRFSLQLDHGAVIPLYYLYKAGFRGQVVHLSVGFLTYPEMYAFGKAVQGAIEMTRQKVAVVASGDLSHRLIPSAPAGYSPSGRKFDDRIMALLQAMDVKSMFALEPDMVEEAGECGLRPIFFLMGTLDGMDAGAEILSYEGPFGVGYGVVIFSINGRRKAKEG
ncbi:MAG TPA: AmmeMemoRadiSam system protein B [Negativicutes bacterium]|nr:AmmeMemoRadiSam system protein B [Negativicutes bacterium]